MNQLTCQSVVIYTRVSSDLSRVKDSVVDQERKSRQKLDECGIYHGDAIVISDVIPGTIDDRPGLNELRQLVADKKVAVVVVDDLSRLSRGPNVQALVTDIRFNGGRFISAGEGIDTEREGWESLVTIFGLHHSTSNKELGRRVRRGLEGRMLDGHGSNGNFPYGYKSAYVDKDWQEQLARRKKPKKVIETNEEEAEVVRWIFKAYVFDGLGMSLIAKEANRRGIPTGQRGTSRRWNDGRIAKILKNTKYIGRWVWGSRETIRSSKGLKRSRPAASQKPVVSERPLLRIVDQELWDAAQSQRCKNRDHHKIGQQKENPKLKVPDSNLAGLFTCGHCGRRIRTMTLAKYGRYIYCGTHYESECVFTQWVRIKKVEEAVFGIVADIGKNYPTWLSEARTAMEQTIVDSTSTTPKELDHKRDRLRTVKGQLANLVDQLAGGNVQIRAIDIKLQQLQDEADHLESEIQERERTAAFPIEIPSNEWVKEQLAGLAGLLGVPSPHAASLLRSIIVKAQMFQVDRGGRKKTLQIRFRIKCSALLSEVIGSASADRVRLGLSRLAASSHDESPEYVIDVATPTLTEVWGPTMNEMRKKGLTWPEISKKTGIQEESAKHHFTRWKKWQGIVDPKPQPLWAQWGPRLHELRLRELTWKQIAEQTKLKWEIAEQYYTRWVKLSGTKRFTKVDHEYWGQKVFKLRKQNMTWDQIAENLGITRSEAQGRFYKWKEKHDVSEPRRMKRWETWGPKIHAMYEENLGPKEIAEKTGLTPNYICVLYAFWKNRKRTDG